METKHNIPKTGYAGSIPVTHDMSLREAPFRAVADGTKVIEMRLLDEKRRTIRVGDRIRFTLSGGTESVTAEVVGLHRFPSFEALYASLIPVVGAVGLGYAEGETADPADMLDYYAPEAVERYGVVGIEIKLKENETMDFEEIICHGEGLTLPRGFAERMREMLGEAFPAFCESYAKPTHPSLRVNTLKLTASELREIAPFAGRQIPWQEKGFYYSADGDVRPGKHPLHEAGAYYIQEASAMLPASLCPPVPGERVLDLCAAPGGKATQLAAALCGEGLLVANEIHPTRAGILSQNMERMGVRNAVVTNATPAELSKKFPAFFDRIVVDAPCSGEGMFRKEADAVTMWSPENVSLCAARQAEILDEAAKMLRPGGYLTYSTCTFAPAENEGAVLDFLSRHPEFEVVPSAAPAVAASRETGLLDGGRPVWAEGYEQYSAELLEQVGHAYRVFPHHCDGEGHFAVLLRKGGDESPCGFESHHRSSAVHCLSDGGKKKSRKPEKPNGGKGKPASEAIAVGLFEDFCREVIGGVPAWATDAVPCLFGDKLYLAPKALCGESDPAEAMKGIRVLRAGLCVGSIVGLDRGKGRFEPDHALALCAGAEIRSLDVDYDSAVAYLKGETLPCDLRGWHTVSYCGLALGWGKASDGVMKNHYPKGLRW